MTNIRARTDSLAVLPGTAPLQVTLLTGTTMLREVTSYEEGQDNE